MFNLVLVILAIISAFSHSVPIGSIVYHQNSRSLSIQNGLENEARIIHTSIEEIDMLTELQLAEDDALYNDHSMSGEDEDYDCIYINDYNAYLDIIEDASTWRQ